MTAEQIRAARRRSPPKEVRLVLPVWGHHYVSQFLFFLLPTLLAKDNIPALAAEVPVRFIVLCSSGSVSMIRGHPAWQRLTSICTAELKSIDDIIMSSGSASTTVTLAFEREVRAAGDAMVDTAFIFLTPDYVMANGSILSLWRRLEDGVSGIQAGNFQVVSDALKFDKIADVRLEWTRPSRKRKAEAGDDEDSQESAVLDLIDPTGWEPTPDEGALNPAAEGSRMPVKAPKTVSSAAGLGVVTVAEIPPRQLAAFSLDNLHPVTVSNTVNFLASHNAHTNRLFWRVDEKTLIGRFYLMHMICIRPEVTNFQIGSSCDYSFIPEMCPSGNVDVITDSDEYFVIEAQPHSHELKFSRFGALKSTSLARSLSEWTTDHHRANIGHTLVFHAGPIPQQTNVVRAESDTFIDSVTTMLAMPAMPTRGHPYWRHAAAYSHFFSGKAFTDEDYHALLTSVTGYRSMLGRIGERFERFVLGGRPMLWPWQPRWMDFRLVKNRLQAVLDSGDKNVLLVTNQPLYYLEWAHKLSSRLVVSYPWHFSIRSLQESRKWATRFDVIVVELGEADLASRISVNRMVDAAAPGAEMIVIVRNQRRHNLSEFNYMVTGNIDLLQPTGAKHLFARFVKLGRLRWMIDRALERLAVASEHHPRATPIVMPITILVMILAVPLNLLALATSMIRWPRQKWSSVVLGFRVSETKHD